jgi:hypothetical protein
MSEQKLAEDLARSRAEVARLTERLASVTPTVRKDLSLISLVPKWSGAESAAPLAEFLASVESAAGIGRWDEGDCLQVAALRLQDPAKMFYNAHPELHPPNATWEGFKIALGERFRDVHTDQFHFSKLQNARQEKNEGPQDFADRCRLLAQKTMCKTGDPAAQRIHQENADQMCLASFVAVLTGVTGRQVRFANPQSLKQALMIALSVTEADRQDRGREIFYTDTGEPSGRPPRENRDSKRDSRNGNTRGKVTHGRADLRGCS